MTALRSLRTPAGTFQVAFSAQGIARVLLPGEGEKGEIKSTGAEQNSLTSRQKKIFRGLAFQFKKYFSGASYSFKNLPVDLSVCTPFQKRVLLACRRIPSGKTISYRTLARQAGTPRASRAVGNALAKNRVPILIPCHRVVRGNGGLGGFTAGLAWKKRLLQAEERGCLKSSPGR